MVSIDFSLVLIGKTYIKKFQDYSIYSLKKNIDKINSKDLSLTFFISTQKHFKKKIDSIFKKHFKNFTNNLIYDYCLEKKKHNKITYHDISKIQRNHLIESESKKSKFLIFLYSDIIYSNNAFFESLKILKNNNKLSAVGSFGLAFNINKNFKIFFQKLLNDKDYLRYFFKNFNSLITNFHKKFLYGNSFNLKSNLVIVKKKNGIIIKSLHYHPIIIRLDRVINNKISTLDSSLKKIFNSIDEIYIEKNMHKISIFSFDGMKSLRNNRVYANKIKTTYKKKDLKNFFFIELYLRLNKNYYEYYKNNYIFLSFSKNLKINAFNKFIFFILESRIDMVKKIVSEKYKLMLNNIPYMHKKDLFFSFLKTYIIYSKITEILFIRKLIILLFTNFNLINSHFIKKNNQLFTFRFLLFVSYSLTNKLKFFLPSFSKKKII
jgi:hypothetical protein